MRKQLLRILGHWGRGRYPAFPKIIKEQPDSHIVVANQQQHSDSSH